MAEETGIPQARRKIDEVIRENVGAITSRFEKPEQVEDGEMVLGWFLIVETMAPAEIEGEQTQSWAIHTLSADVNADRDLVPWNAKGYLHHVLDDPENYLMDYDHFAEDDD